MYFTSIHKYIRIEHCTNLQNAYYSSQKGKLQFTPPYSKWLLKASENVCGLKVVKNQWKTRLRKMHSLILAEKSA